MRNRFSMAGATPSHGDFNVYHHLANARLLKKTLKGFVFAGWLRSSASQRALSSRNGWSESLKGGESIAMRRMEALPTMKAYLEERPQLVGIGKDPGLLDKAPKEP